MEVILSEGFILFMPFFLCGILHTGACTLLFDLVELFLQHSIVVICIDLLVHRFSNKLGKIQLTNSIFTSLADI